MQHSKRSISDTSAPTTPRRASWALHAGLTLAVAVTAACGSVYEESQGSGLAECSLAVAGTGQESPALSSAHCSADALLPKDTCDGPQEY